MLSDECECTANFWDMRTPFIPEAGDTEKLIFKLSQMSFYYYTFRLCVIPITEYHTTDISYFEDQ